MTNHTTRDILLLALVLLSACVVGAILYRRRRSVADFVTEDLRFFILGSIPPIRASRKDENAREIVETFRRMQLNIRYAADPSRPMAVVVTGYRRGAGASLVASNLALSFAGAGHRTVLIDADLARGELHHTFGVPSSPGLAEVVGGVCDVTSALHEAPGQTHLTIVPAGDRSVASEGLASGESAQAIVRGLTSSHDVVIVDAPSLNHISDVAALVVASGNLMVVFDNAMPNARSAAEAVDGLERMPVRILGAVLNKTHRQSGAP